MPASSRGLRKRTILIAAATAATAALAAPAHASAGSAGWAGSRASGGDSRTPAANSAPRKAVPVPAEAPPRPRATQQAYASRTLSVPEYSQQMSDDCEAASLRMLLAYRGHYVSDSQILDQIHVDLAHPHAGISGSQSGDPYIAFVGNPNGDEEANTGFGVYYPRIAAASAAEGLPVVEAGQGISPTDVYHAVSEGHPAEVWVDYLWRARTPSYYTAFDGRKVLYAGPAEHAVVIAGVKASSVLINDPARGSYWIPKSQFEAGFSTYQDMAVIVQ